MNNSVKSSWLNFAMQGIIKKEGNARRRLLLRINSIVTHQTLLHTAKALSIQYGRSPDL